MKTDASVDLRENDGAGAGEPFRRSGGESPEDEPGSAGVERTLE
jgi:hypothetical protein